MTRIPLAMASLLLPLTACSGEDSPSRAADDATTTEAAAETSAAPGEEATEPEETDAQEDDDGLGGFVTGQAKDLQWRFAEPPASWTRLESETGTVQWRVGERCSVLLEQPAGLGTGRTPTREDVLERTVGRLESAVGTELQRETGERRLPGETNRDARLMVTFATAHVTGGEVEGDVFAYRAGDFALTLTAACGAGEYDDVHASDLEPWFDRLGIYQEY